MDNRENADPTDNTEIEIIVTDNSRGAIFVNKQLLYKGFPNSTEYLDDEFDKKEDIDVSSFRAFECLEGTLIRVFHYNGKWYTTTTRKLDAFVSKWASPKITFGQSFVNELRSLVSSADKENDKEFLNIFYDTYLDKDKAYIFLLRPSKEERIVCDEYLGNKIIYVCSETKCTSFNFDDKIILIDGKEIPKRREIFGLTTPKDVSNYVFERINYKTCQGIILFKSTIDDELISVKVLSKEYSEKYKIRGNVSSLRFRYLELRANNKDLDVFFELYPEMKSVGFEMEESIYKLCKRLHVLYMKIYIENDRALECFKEEQSALKIIHKQYTLTRQRTTPGRINDILTAGNPTRLNRLLREFTYYRTEDEY